MIKLNSEQVTELQRLLSPEIKETDLFAQLAESAGLGADEIDRPGEGRLLFSRIWKRCGNTICAHPLVKAYVSNPTISDTTTVAAQIINLLVQVDGINVIVVAALSLRIGLRTLCAYQSGPDAPVQDSEIPGGTPPT